ncbi:hypothetical protein ACE6JH_10490 [Streptomyces nigra]
MARAWHARQGPAARGQAVRWGQRALTALDAFAAGAEALPPTGLRLAAAIEAAVAQLTADR